MPDARAAKSPTPTVTVVIRAKTQSRLVLNILDILERQSLPPGEIIIIDSGSSAPIIDEFKRRPVRLIQIAPEEFTSASALNQAIAQAKGQLIAILSHDALPCGPDYLKILASAFDSEQVAGAYGRQVPRGPSDHPLNIKDLEKTYPAASRVQTDECWFDNACSMIRADLWRRRSFCDSARTAEDHEWAKWAIGQGYAIQYQAEAKVEHSHPRTLRGAWRRFTAEGEGLARIHGRPLALHQALGGWARETASDVAWLARRGRLLAIFSSPGLRLAKHLGLWRGYRKGMKDS